MFDYMGKKNKRVFAKICFTNDPRHPRKRLNI